MPGSPLNLPLWMAKIAFSLPKSSSPPSAVFSASLSILIMFLVHFACKPWTRWVTTLSAARDRGYYYATQQAAKLDLQAGWDCYIRYWRKLVFWATTQSKRRPADVAIPNWSSGKHLAI